MTGLLPKGADLNKVETREEREDREINRIFKDEIRRAVRDEAYWRGDDE